MPLEGLDARDALPPLLHPAMLMDTGSYHAWEQVVVTRLGEEGTAQDALGCAIRFTERLRTWQPSHGPLREAVQRAAHETGAAAVASCGAVRRPPVEPRLTAEAARLDRLVRDAVPPGLDAPSQPTDTASAFSHFAAPTWDAFARPITRYLAARAFANWCAYQGRGLRTVLGSVVAALSVLRVEAARHCAAAVRPLDAPLLTQAFRSADLLIVHLASREELARRLSALEDERVEELTQAL
jgi:hypothetical protein